MGSEAQTSYRLSSPLAGLQWQRIQLWGGDVSFKLPSQDGGEPLNGGVGVVGNDVSRRHPLEIHDVVHRGHGKGSQDTEAEGALGVLGDPAT